MLYRSGNLAQLDDTGIEQLRGLGIRSIIDLRDDDEVAHAPSRVEKDLAQWQDICRWLDA